MWEKKIFLELFNEFSSDNSPEFTQLFAEIAGELTYRRKVSMEERDSWLQDFSKGFSGSYRDTDGSVLDSDLPQAYVEAFHRINGPESNNAGQKQQKDYNVVAGGISIHGGPHSVVCFQGTGNIVSGSRADALAFIQEFIVAMNQMEDDPVAPSSEVSPANQNAKVAYGNPVLQARAERNEREMEKYAKASGVQYPKWT
jgi:hypothetical protein